MRLVECHFPDSIIPAYLLRQEFSLPKSTDSIEKRHPTVGQHMFFCVKLVCLAFMFNFAYANNPPPERPSFVYRVDTRGPDEIMGNQHGHILGTGFRARGSNTNYVEHVGRPANAQLSAFIATTADNTVDLDQVHNIARALYRFNPSYRQQNLWVYRIRATRDFYQGVRTLEYIADTNPALARAAANLIPITLAQNEWFTANPIPSDLIQHAQQITRVDDNQVTIETVPRNNRFFNWTDTRANDEPFRNGLANTVQNFRFIVRDLLLLPFAYCLGKGGTNMYATDADIDTECAKFVMTMEANGTTLQNQSQAIVQFGLFGTFKDNRYIDEMKRY